ncbi:MAG: UxaA family hydrolase [Haloarculaceae archaeon]
MTSDVAPATFDGFPRSDGRVGVRNRVLVLPSVICSHVVADRIADRVEGAVSAPHDHGCGQIGADEAQTRRTFLGLAANPNVAGTVLVGLGCETIQSDDVAGELDARDVPVREVAIQDVGGTDECIERGAEIARQLRDEQVRGDDRTPTTLADLTVGVVSSDLAETTREHADPLVGSLVDDVLDAGGRVVVAGSERATAHPEAVREATASTARKGIDALLERHADRVPAARRVAHEATTLGFEDATAVWGDRQIEAVIEYGERFDGDGLALVDAPSQFEEATTALAAAGAQIVVHVTADGQPAGHPVVPVLKVTGDAEIAAALADDIDVDATTADGSTLRERLLDVAGGAACCAEHHGLDAFAINRVGPSM